MEFSSQLKAARMAAGLTQRQVADAMGITNSTYCGYETGKREPDVAKIKLLSRILGIPADDLLDTGISAQKKPLMSVEALKLAQDYDEKLDAWGRKQVRDVADNEIVRCEDASRILEEIAPLVEEEPKIIPLYWAPAAAGLAAPISGSDFDYYTLKPDDPQGAMFAIKVQGDSMEPHFPDGAIAFCNKDPLADGDIGVFCLDGDSFIKQYHYDRMTGITYLFSLNRQRADADKVITRTSGQTLTCMGRVITQRRYPLPQ